MVKPKVSGVADYFLNEREPMNDLVSRLSSKEAARTSKLSQSVTIRFPVPLLAILDAIADRTNDSRSAAVIELLETSVREILNLLDKEDREVLLRKAHYFEQCAEINLNYEPAEAAERIASLHQDMEQYELDRVIERHEADEEKRLNDLIAQAEKGE